MWVLVEGSNKQYFRNRIFRNFGMKKENFRPSLYEFLCSIQNNFHGIIKNRFKNKNSVYIFWIINASIWNLFWGPSEECWISMWPKIQHSSLGPQKRFQIDALIIQNWPMRNPFFHVIEFKQFFFLNLQSINKETVKQ